MEGLIFTVYICSSLPYTYLMLSSWPWIYSVDISASGLTALYIYCMYSWLGSLCTYIWWWVHSQKCISTTELTALYIPLHEPMLWIISSKVGSSHIYIQWWAHDMLYIDGMYPLMGGYINRIHLQVGSLLHTYLMMGSPPQIFELYISASGLTTPYIYLDGLMVFLVCIHRWAQAHCVYIYLMMGSQPKIYWLYISPDELTALYISSNQPMVCMVYIQRWAHSTYISGGELMIQYDWLYIFTHGVRGHVGMNPFQSLEWHAACMHNTVKGPPGCTLGPTCVQAQYAHVCVMHARTTKDGMPQNRQLCIQRHSSNNGPRWFRARLSGDDPLTHDSFPHKHDGRMIRFPHSWRLSSPEG
jgi:hypothetical protein